MKHLIIIYSFCFVSCNAQNNRGISKDYRNLTEKLLIDSSAIDTINVIHLSINEIQLYSEIKDSYLSENEFIKKFNSPKKVRKEIDELDELELKVLYYSNSKFVFYKDSNDDFIINEIDIQDNGFIFSKFNIRVGGRLDSLSSFFPKSYVNYLFEKQDCLNIIVQEPNKKYFTDYMIKIYIKDKTIIKINYKL